VTKPQNTDLPWETLLGKKTQQTSLIYSISTMKSLYKKKTRDTKDLCQTPMPRRPSETLMPDRNPR